MRYHMLKTPKFDFSQRLKSPYYDVIDDFFKFLHLDICKFVLSVKKTF